MKILIVDDEQVTLLGIKESVDFKRLGINDIYTAESMAKAQSIIRRNHPDIILCDIEMPFGTGIELVEWIREEKMDIICIFLTAHSDFDFARQALRMQCFDYLLKPASPVKIEEVLSRAIGELKKYKKIEEYQNYGEIYVKEIIGKTDEDNMITDIVDDCVEYIRLHISEDLSVSEIAAIHYVNPDHLTRLFKKRFDKTVIDYIHDQRMFLAQEMLENTKLSITMISAKVGYGNFSAFTTSFKKYTGMTPREYRALKEQK